MIEDASASIVEAEKIVQSMQHQVEVEGLGDTPIDVVGWGQRKSVEELWADVLSEVCLILRIHFLAQHADIL